MRTHGPVWSSIRVLTTPGAVRHAPPTLGQHTDDVLAELGYSVEQIEALQASGAITPRVRQEVK